VAATTVAAIVAGAAALFLHGAPLNGFQWRGAIDRLTPYRRCIAPDFMGIRWVPKGKLFFQEEFPDVIAEEALHLWRSV